jgi:hypothetical protein
MASVGKGNGMRLRNLTEILLLQRSFRKISLAPLPPCCVWRRIHSWGNWVSDLADGEWRGG